MAVGKYILKRDMFELTRILQLAIYSVLALQLAIYSVLANIHKFKARAYC